MKRRYKVAIMLGKRMVLVALSDEEYSALSHVARDCGLSPGRLMARLVRMGGESDRAHLADLPLTAWVRDIVMHAIGYAPGSIAQDRAHAMLALGALQDGSRL